MIPSMSKSEITVGLRSKLPTGRCVMLRVSGQGLDQYWLSGGEIVENLERSDLCRSQILVQADEDLGAMLANPLGNHRIVVPGDYVEIINPYKWFTEFVEGGSLCKPD